MDEAFEILMTEIEEKVANFVVNINKEEIADWLNRQIQEKLDTEYVEKNGKDYYYEFLKEYKIGPYMVSERKSYWNLKTNVSSKTIELLSEGISAEKILAKLEELIKITYDMLLEITVYEILGMLDEKEEEIEKKYEVKVRELFAGD